MKVKTINRSEEDYTKERLNDIKKVHRNYDPTLHQFSQAHEYTRAVNAVKLERVFAQPFLAALAHSDGITTLARNPRTLNSLLAGSADGEIRIWDIPAKRTLRRLVGHKGAPWAA
jgi:WD repeat and SOF domain-containing protein 1